MQREFSKEQEHRILQLIRAWANREMKQSFIGKGGILPGHVTSDASGDILIGDSGNTTSILPCGTQGQVLRVASTGTPAWSDAISPYYAKMYLANSGSPTHTSNGGAQKVGSGGGTATWTSEFDIRPSGVSAQVDTSTNKRLDVRKSGVYLVQGAVYFTSLTDGKTASVNVYVSGTGNLIFEHKIVGAATDTYVSVSRLYKLTSGDYLELYAYQNDSGSEAYFPGTKLIYLSMMYVGPSA